MTKRVVVTGLGPVTGFGVGIDPLWEAMLEGRTCIRRIEAFDPSGFATQAAGELAADAFKVRDFVPKSYRKSTKVMCRDIELAVAAARAAIDDAGIVTRGTTADDDPDAATTIDPDRFGCHIGAGLIAADLDELTYALSSAKSEDPNGPAVDLAIWGEKGMQNLTPLWLLKYLPNMLACHVTIVHDCRGPSNTITCCEASAHLSLGESTRAIQRGAADACVTGGAESKLNPMAYARALMSERFRASDGADDAAVAVRPFTAEADGSLLGEGGAILVVEAEDAARARGATPYAVVSGFGATQGFWVDARGVERDPDDHSLDDAIEIALEGAGLTPDQVDAVVPFGSGTPSIDHYEMESLRRVLGMHADAVPIVCTVPATGSCAAGNGGIGLAVACRMIRDQRVPAQPHRGSAAEPRELRHVLVSTTSQGGQNAAVVLSRP